MKSRLRHTAFALSMASLLFPPAILADEIGSEATKQTFSKYRSAGDAQIDTSSIDVQVKEESESAFLKGKVQKQHRSSRSKQEKGSLRPGQAEGENELKLSSNAASEAETEEVKIEWNRWRNRVNHSVWSKFCVLVNGGDAIVLGGLVLKLGNAPVPNFAVGTKATYVCDIDNERNVKNVRLTHPSGNKRFDQMVLRAVESLQGKSLLRFPKGSQRQLVSESLQLSISNNGGFHDSHENDVETYKASADDGKD